MIRNKSLSVIAAAVFAALSTAAVAQSSGTNARQSTGASQSSQTNPVQSVNPSAATGVQSDVGVRGNNNSVRQNSNATTNQSTSASQNTSSSTPVAALGFTYCSGFVCELWLAPVDWRAFALPDAPRERCSGATFCPCVFAVFCDAEVD